MASSDEDYILPYFSKKRSLKCLKGSECSVSSACECARTKCKKNPWTGRWLRKTVRGKLKHDCDVWEKRKRPRKSYTANLIYYDSDRVKLSVTVDIPEDHQLEYLSHGVDWTVYSYGPRKVLKIRVIKNKRELETVKIEEKIHNMAERHHVGPKIYSWDIDRRARITTIKKKIPKDYLGVAVVVAERFHHETTKNDKMRRSERYDQLKKDLKKMEKMHLIIIEEAKAERNLMYKNNGEMAVVDLNRWRPMYRDEKPIFDCNHKYEDI